MTKTTNSQEVDQVKTPDVETLKSWVQKDLEAAHYLIGFVLTNKAIREKVIQEMAQSMYEYSQTKPFEKDATN